LEQDADSYSEDPAMYDEESSMQQGGAQSKGTINDGRTKGGNFNVAPEDSVAPADREELADDEGAPSETGFPARLLITIEKEGVKGALHIESVVRDGEIMTENVHYFPSKELADAKTAEQDWARRSVYTGPPFANLDEDLQILIDRYVAERGIDTALALWIPDYVDYKEQKEYVNWLSGMFIDYISACNC
jgi:complement component 1 Q subcomponent-binding protein, mitochondrial